MASAEKTVIRISTLLLSQEVWYRFLCLFLLSWRNSEVSQFEHANHILHEGRWRGSNWESEERQTTCIQHCFPSQQKTPFCGKRSANDSQINLIQAWLCCTNQEFNSPGTKPHSPASSLQGLHHHEEWAGRLPFPHLQIHYHTKICNLLLLSAFNWSIN